MIKFISFLFAALCAAVASVRSFAVAVVYAAFSPVRRFAAVLAAMFGLSLSSSALAQLHEVETVLGTVSFADTGAVTIPVDATITSGLGIWFALFAIGVVIALLMRLVRFRRG